MSAAQLPAQPHRSLAETAPAPTDSPTAPTGRRAYWYSATAERQLTDPDWQPRHSAILPAVPRPFRLRD